MSGLRPGDLVSARITVDGSEGWHTALLLEFSGNRWYFAARCPQAAAHLVVANIPLLIAAGRPDQLRAGAVHADCRDWPPDFRLTYREFIKLMEKSEAQPEFQSASDPEEAPPARAGGAPNGQAPIQYVDERGNPLQVPGAVAYAASPQQVTQGVTATTRSALTFARRAAGHGLVADGYDEEDEADAGLPPGLSGLHRLAQQYTGLWEHMGHRPPAAAPAATASGALGALSAGSHHRVPLAPGLAPSVTGVPPPSALYPLLAGGDQLWGSQGPAAPMRLGGAPASSRVTGTGQVLPEAAPVWSTPAYLPPPPLIGHSGSGPPDLNLLIQLELLRVLGTRREDLELGPLGSPTEGGHRGVERSLRSLHQMKNEIHRRPQGLVTEYINKVREILGVVDGQVWTFSDFNKRIAWGKHKGLQRMHFMLGEVLVLMDSGRVAEAEALVCQCLKATHQAALDDGDWRVAWHLTGLRDPLLRQRWGGTERELETIAAYSKAMEDLATRMKKEHGRDTEADEQPTDAAPTGTKPKGGKKGQ